MSFTIKNLREVDDMAPRFGMDEVQEARFAWRALDSETIGLALHTIKPDCRQAFAHRHEQAEEIYVVISGSGQVKLDDEVREVALMDAVRISPDVARAFAAGPEGLELLVFGPHFEPEFEVLKGDFWADEA
jgi:mannose-6-phosphate isomerase-like protein (cupin superfamily)